MVGGVQTPCHTRLPSFNYAGSNVQPSVITHSLTGCNGWVILFRALDQDQYHCWQPLGIQSCKKCILLLFINHKRQQADAAACKLVANNKT
jgi:hypothetical protein